jgi:hypothetical protein
MIYHRIKPNGKYLKSSDYVHGFGVDFSLVNRIRKIRNLEGSDEFRFDNRSGFAIDGTEFNNRYHPVFDSILTDSKTGERLHIDGTYKHHHYGYYWIILWRNDKNSHGIMFWKNETCKDPDIIKKIKQHNKKFTFVKKINNNQIVKLLTKK